MHEVYETSEGPDVALAAVNGVTSRLRGAPLLEAGVTADGRRHVQVDSDVKINDGQLGFAVLISDYNVVRLEITVTDIGVMNAVNSFN